jgi:hypothetical protein
MVFENFQIPVSGYNSFSALFENGECEEGDGRETRSENSSQEVTEHGLEGMLKYPRAPGRRKTPDPKVTVVTNFTQNNRRGEPPRANPPGHVLGDLPASSELAVALESQTPCPASGRTGRSHHIIRRTGPAHQDEQAQVDSSQGDRTTQPDKNMGQEARASHTTSSRGRRMQEVRNGGRNEALSKTDLHGPNWPNKVRPQQSHILRAPNTVW